MAAADPNRQQRGCTELFLCLFIIPGRYQAFPFGVRCVYGLACGAVEFFNACCSLKTATVGLELRRSLMAGGQVRRAPPACYLSLACSKRKQECL